MNKQLLIFGIAVVSTSIGCRPVLEPTFEANLVHSHKYELTEGVSMAQVVDDTEWAVEKLFGTPNEPRIPAVLTEDSELAGLLSQDNLELAAGPETHDENGQISGGLYRKHCYTCHGMAGDGRGPTGAILNPYPRDYRMGIFKFKSTPRSSKPTKDDIAKLLRHGIGGTAMNPIAELNEDPKRIDALVDYVIYLSLRGEVERGMMDAAVLELDVAGGDRIIRPELADLANEELTALTDTESEQLDAFESQLDADYEKELVALAKRDATEMTDAKKDELLASGDLSLDDDELEELKSISVKKMPIEDIEKLLAAKYENLSDAEVLEIRDRLATESGKTDLIALRDRARKIEQKEMFEENWSYITEAIVDTTTAWIEAEDEVTELTDRGDIPVPGSRAELVAMLAGADAGPLEASIERGHQLFISEKVGCAKCHGKEGKGDGQNTDYDDWTKDWTTSVNLDPKNTQMLMPLMARGALEPHNIIPRNFSEGLFRGGSDPDDLYRRIANGIAGTPMPEATFIEGEFSPEDIWHLVNFVRSLDQSEVDAETPKPAINESAMVRQAF